MLSVATRSRNFRSSSMVRCFASKSPPRTNKEPSKSSREKRKKSISGSNSTPREIISDCKPNRFKSKRIKEWKNRYSSQLTNVSPVQPSDFLYNDLRRRSLIENDDVNHLRKESPRMTLQALDASCLLDPLSFCKSSAKGDVRHGVGRSISGGDAARRLLRGKKDFLISAKKLRVPVKLDGHGIPKQLLQHCVDMADNLLIAFGDVAELTFHNYNNQKMKLPQVLRIRNRDATNRCSRWPPEPSRTSRCVDWDYHMNLYLAVMERLATTLGQVINQKNFAPSPSNDNDDEDEFTSSPLLFPSSSTPHWNVDISRGSYFELYHRDDFTDKVPLFPIVEFSQIRDSELQQNGHILIRLQGTSLPNDEFTNIQSSRKPVSLVFDACFRSENQRPSHKSPE